MKSYFHTQWNHNFDLFSRTPLALYIHMCGNCSYILQFRPVYCRKMLVVKWYSPLRCSTFLILAHFICRFATISGEAEVRNLIQEPIAIPQVPKAPSCGDSFPGTPQWNKCWDNFRIDMAMFQYHMQEYGIQVSKMIENSAARGKVKPNTLSSWTSSVFTNGYTIQTKGLSISTTTQNGNLQIKLPIPAMTNIQSNVNGQDIEIRVGGAKEEMKIAKIRFPDNVRLTDIKLHRMEDSMIVSGPIEITKNSIVQSSINYAVSPSFPFQHNYAGQSARQASQMWFF